MWILTTFLLLLPILQIRSTIPTDIGKTEKSSSLGTAGTNQKTLVKDNPKQKSIPGTIEGRLANVKSVFEKSKSPVSGPVEQPDSGKSRPAQIKIPQIAPGIVTRAKSALGKVVQKDKHFPMNQISLKKWHRMDLSLTEAHEIVHKLADFKIFRAKNSNSSLYDVVKSFNSENEGMKRLMEIWCRTDYLANKMTQIATTGTDTDVEMRIEVLGKKIDQFLVSKEGKQSINSDNKVNVVQINQNGIGLIILYKIAEKLSKMIVDEGFHAEALLEMVKADPASVDQKFKKAAMKEKECQKNKKTASCLNVKFYRTKAQMYARRQLVILRQIITDGKGRIALQNFVEKLEKNLESFLKLDLGVSVEPSKERLSKWALLWNYQAPEFAKTTLVMTDVNALINFLNVNTSIDPQGVTILKKISCLKPQLKEGGLKQLESIFKKPSPKDTKGKEIRLKDIKSQVDSHLGPSIQWCVNDLHMSYEAAVKQYIVIYKTSQKLKPFIEFGKKLILELNKEFNNYKSKVELLMVNKAAEMITRNFIMRIGIAEKKKGVSKVDKKHYKMLQKLFRGRQMIIIEELLKAASLNERDSEAIFLLKSDLKELMRSLQEEHLDKSKKEVVVIYDGRVGYEHPGTWKTLGKNALAAEETGDVEERDDGKVN